MSKTNTISRFGLASLLAASLLAQGCVGVVTWGTHEQTFEPASVTQKPATFAVSTVSKNAMAVSPTPHWLEQHWGRPSHVKRLASPEQHELWTYNFHHQWCGVVPCAILPIPLLLPVGRERVVFCIRDGRVASAEVITTGGYQVVAGLGPKGPFADCGPWH